MKTINLKQLYYPFYEKDTFVEVEDEIADAIMEEHRIDENTRRKLWAHTYSLDESPGLEYHSGAGKFLRGDSFAKGF